MKNVLFGSDYPVLDTKKALDAVKKLGFTPEEQEDVLGDNISRLLGLK